MRDLQLVHPPMNRLRRLVEGTLQIREMVVFAATQPKSPARSTFSAYLAPRGNSPI
jgi:hypothetical protein